MKVDKELLIKHRFWIGLGLAVPLALVGITILMTSVSAQIAKVRKDIDTNLLRIKKVPAEVFNEDGIRKAQEVAALAKSKQVKVWEAAYRDQADLYTWPEPVEEQFEFTNGYFASEIQVLRDKDAKDSKAWPEDQSTPPTGILHGIVSRLSDERGFEVTNRKGQKIGFHYNRIVKVIDGASTTAQLVGQHSGKVVAIKYQKSKYFGDPLTRKEQPIYTGSYKNQILPLLMQVDPLRLDEKGRVAGAVQLKGMSTKGTAYFDPTTDPPDTAPCFRYLAKRWEGASDISEEAWYAQEDLWVQREVYRLIGVANSEVARLTRVDQQTNPKDGKGIFQNPYFILDLKLNGTNLDVKITNKLKRRQKLDQEFLVQLAENGPPEKIKIEGEPLDPAGTQKSVVTQTKPLGPNPRRTGVYGVEQVLSWENAAVRRIDDVVFAEDAALSQRTSVTLPMRGLTTPEGGDPAAAGAPGTPGMPGGPDAGSSRFRGRGRGGRGGAGGPGAGGGGGGGAAGLPNNFWWRERYTDVTREARRMPVAVSLIVDQDHVDRVLTAFNNSKLRFLTNQVVLNHYPGSLRPLAPEATTTPGTGFTGGFPAGGAFPPPGSSGYPGAAGQEAAQDMEANMELVIYGIITLYNRYPPLPQAAAAPPPETK
jgi:hypothetical protein